MKLYINKQPLTSVASEGVVRLEASISKLELMIGACKCYPSNLTAQPMQVIIDDMKWLHEVLSAVSTSNL